MTYSAHVYEDYTPKAYCPREDTYAVISPEQKKLGRIKAVATTGITFDYIDESQNPSRFEENTSTDQTIDIFIKKRGYFLKNLPIQRLTDTVVISTPTFYHLPMRQIKIEFGQLDEREIRSLEYLIGHYAAYESL